MIVRVSPRAVAGLQAAYLVGTGAWPLVDRSSFEAITGKKVDFWLVRTVGGLALAIGASLGIAVVQGRKERQTTALALASGVVFGLADLRAARSHSRIYLADTALQVAFASGWLRRW